MPFDHMDNFIDVHDARSAWSDEQEQQDCLENETHIEEAARQIVKILREHWHGQWLEALPDDNASVVSLDAEQNVAKHDSLDPHEYADQVEPKVELLQREFCHEAGRLRVQLIVVIVDFAQFLLLQECLIIVPVILLCMIELDVIHDTAEERLITYLGCCFMIPCRHQIVVLLR